ncbi:MAG: NAD(P)/FAD-dependent oxidoreductase [Candidatus Heimdallarchaeota archaeon]|nr:NAD(P)/FAD-dependent oxidoreductase [Candidatus Heimdallarchaeota archaeon]MBY8995337.1 NAD(P)/FAD-dependent oxidoreductase [Candidatus Heimdallarchaeota archaeon]
MESDVAIVGAGPIGSLAALHAAYKGVKVSVLEQRKEIGIPNHCAGLLSVNGLMLLGLNNLPRKVIQNSKVMGAKFFSPSGQVFSIRRKEPQAYVINRALFDQHLKQKAESAGVDYLTSRKVMDVNFERKNKILKFECLNLKQNKKEQHTAEVGIIASGSKRNLPRDAGFRKIPAKKYLIGYQYDVENISDLDSSMVEIYSSNKLAPGFFVYIIPTSQTSAKVGLASREKLAINNLNQFIEKSPFVKDRFVNSKIVKKNSGRIIINGLLRNTSANGLLITGDAAGQTKATTGGGVITGGIAGIIAGEVAAESVHFQDNSKRFLKMYDDLWKDQLLPQFKSMAFFRWCVNRLSDKAMEKVFQTIIENNIADLIVEKGDIDSQSEVLRALLRHPAILRLVIRVLPHLQF